MLVTQLKPFKKQEIFGLILIFIVLIVISVPNFVLSLKRARDNTRKGDLGTLVYGLGEFQKDLLTYPLSNNNGEIMACIAPGDNLKTDEKGRIIIDFIACKWGQDGLFDPRDSGAYISVLPNDPTSLKGSGYLYISNGKHFQVYAALESTDDDQYDETILKRNLMCGNRICNTGRSDGSTPLNISIEEYEESIHTR